MAITKEQRKKMYQTPLFILWKEGVSDEKAQKIIEEIYKKHSDYIKSMETFQNHLGYDFFEEWQEFFKKCQ